MCGVVEVSDFVAAICPVREAVGDVESFSDVSSVQVVFGVVGLGAERQSRSLGLFASELHSCFLVQHSADEVSLRTRSSVEVASAVEIVWIKIGSLIEELVNQVVTLSEAIQLTVVIAVEGVSFAASLNSAVVEGLSDQSVIIVKWDQGVVVQREGVNSVTDGDSLEVREVGLISSYFHSEGWDVDAT